MDYGIVAKMVQADLCSKGLTAASLESAPLLVESYLKTIGLAYNKDDVAAVAGVMTMAVYQLTPCNPGSASATGCECDGSDDLELTESEIAESLYDDIDNIDDGELMTLAEYRSDALDSLEDFLALYERIQSLIPDELADQVIDKNSIIVQQAAVRSAISTIENYADTVKYIKESIEMYI